MEDQKDPTPVNPDSIAPSDAPAQGMNFTFRDMPDRKEIRHILKTGKGQSGEEVHPHSREMLRTARLADLESMGVEVNRANAALNEKIDKVIHNADIAISADRTNFFAFFTFLIEKGVLGETAMEDYQKFKMEYIENMNKAGEYLQKHEKQIHEQAQELIKKSKEEGPNPPPKIITEV